MVTPDLVEVLALPSPLPRPCFARRRRSHRAAGTYRTRSRGRRSRRARGARVSASRGGHRAGRPRRCRATRSSRACRGRGSCRTARCATVAGSRPIVVARLVQVGERGAEPAAADRDPAVAVLRRRARTASDPAAPPMSTGGPSGCDRLRPRPRRRRSARCSPSNDGDVLGPQRPHREHVLAHERHGGASRRRRGSPSRRGSSRTRSRTRSGRPRAGRASRPPSR